MIIKYAKLASFRRKKSVLSVMLRKLSEHPSKKKKKEKKEEEK